LLLLLHDAAADEPVRRRHDGVDGTGDRVASVFDHLRDVDQQGVVAMRRDSLGLLRELVPGTDHRVNHIAQ
jgi:hypothetical protein